MLYEDYEDDTIMFSLLLYAGESGAAHHDVQFLERPQR